MATGMSRAYAERRLVERAWRDEAFLRELLADPKAAAARELGVEFEPDAQVVVHQEPLNTLHIILPVKPAGVSAVQETAVFVRDKDGVIYEIPADILQDYAVSEGERLQAAAKVLQEQAPEVEGQWGRYHPWHTPMCGVRG